MRKKTLTIAIALVLVVALAVGATYAYLTATTNTLTNTFTVGKTMEDPKSNFILKEHKVAYDPAAGVYKYVDASGSYVDAAAAEEVADNTYDSVAPGMVVAKDPFVRIQAPVETPSYLFVEVYGDTTGLQYALADGWQPVQLTKAAPNGGTVYAYQTTLAGSGAVNTYPILKGDQVTVDRMTALSADASLKFSAYLCQSTGFGGAAAAFDACFGK